MNRLQKKCVLATVGVHLLLLVILLVGPAFFQPKPKADNVRVLDVIPANLIDAAFNNGVRNARPPAPAPVVKPTPTPPQRTPPAPKPVEPSPTLMQRVEKIFKPEPPKPAPEKVAKVEPHKIQINTHLVTRTTPSHIKNDQHDSQRAKALQNAVRNLKKNFSPDTKIEMPGKSSAAYASYADAVKSAYDQAWTLPDTIASDNENVKVQVTIASDGTVISARIIEPSGDAALDASVRKTLERVTFIAPFPEGSSDKQRTYTISFNPQVKKMLE
jgi:colicin import membrane protein